MASAPDPSSMTPEELKKYLNGPAFPPPDGIIPNFNNPPNNNGVVIATIVCSLLCTCSFSLLYFHSRVFVIRRFHIADLIALGAFAVYLGLIVRLYQVINYGGYFVHQWNMQMKQMPDWSWHYSQGVILYIFSAMLIRQAILLQWVHIFVPTGTRNVFFWTCHVTFWVNTVFYIAAGVMAAVPKSKIYSGFDLASACMNVFFDVLIFALPQRVIWKLNMPLKEKMSVSFVFTLGLLACTAAIARVVITAERYADSDNGKIMMEQTMMLSKVCLLATAETSFGILVYAVTGIPKALNSLGVVKLVSTISSWLSSSTGRMVSSKQDNSGYYNVDNSDTVPLDHVNYSGRSLKDSELGPPMSKVYTRDGASSHNGNDYRGGQSDHETV